MKAKLLVALLAFVMSTAALACPSGQFNPDSKFNWLIGGQFDGLRVGATGTGLRSFSAVGARTAMFLRRNQIDLDRWVVAGRTDKAPLFRYTGTGSRNFVGALQDARELFVPLRRTNRPDNEPS